MNGVDAVSYTHLDVYKRQVQALKVGKIDCVVIDEQPALAFVKENKGLKILDRCV